MVTWSAILMTPGPFTRPGIPGRVDRLRVREGTSEGGEKRGESRGVHPQPSPYKYLIVGPPRPSTPGTLMKYI